MIIIRIREVEGKVESISLTGHADSAREGEDLVCAGVSTCFLGALKAISDQKQFKMDYSKGNGLVQVIGKPSVHDQLVLEVLKEQLTFVSDSKPLNVKIEKL